MSERLVPELAAAVLDGKPIDWPGAESSADEATRPVLAELRVLAALADIHRHQPPDDGVLTPPAPSDALARWGHLRALERIGRGAFGEVYRAWDTRLDREVALKLIDAEPIGGDDDSSSSFIHEGRLLARVRHPNVVTIYGAEQIGARIGLWMEFVRGRTLKQIVDGGKPFGGAEAVRIGIDIARAVAAVHGAGMLHRDIKAQNVMLADDGRAVLMDFGTGREVADDRSDLAGTPLYLAPEILAGGEATVESDIYSLGVLLYYLVTGSYPVRAETVNDLRLAHQRNERTPIQTSEGRRDLPPKLARIIERALDPRPAGRYASTDALAADLAAFERRPALTVPRAIGAAAVLALIAGLGWEVAGRRVIPSPQIMVVLPFKNLGGEPGSDDLVDGLTDELIRDLGVVEGLQVTSRDSSFTFKDKPGELHDIGRQLGANLVIDGSVLRSGNKLRVEVRMVQLAGNRLLLFEQFDRELKDIVVIRHDIAQAIVDKLRLSLGKGRRRYDTNVEAYELYLKGSALVARGGGGRDRGGENLRQAADVFRQVLDKDPDFAPAHAGLATAYALMTVPSGSTIPFVEAQSIIRTAAVKARDLDPLLADAHAALGWLHARDLDWSKAQTAFQEAINLNPRLTQTYTSYSVSTLRPLGKQEEALRLLRVALQNDPLSLSLQRDIGLVQIDAGLYQEAIDTLRRVSAVEPDFPYVNEFIARALVFAGRPAEAVRLFESMGLGARGRRNPRLVLPYVALGMRAEAEALAAEFKDASPTLLAELYVALGDKDRAFDALGRAAFLEPQRVPLLLVYPQMAPLRGDPRFAAVRQQFRLPPQ